MAQNGNAHFACFIKNYLYICAKFDHLTTNDYNYEEKSLYDDELGALNGIVLRLQQ